MSKQKTIDEDWEHVGEQIDRSIIFRVPWKKLLGESLTSNILRLREKGYSSKEVYEILKESEDVKFYLRKNPKIKEKILENLKISVSARFGENKTSDRLKGFGFKCCLCNKWTLGRGEKKQWGNNPAPLKDSGQCCDKCNEDMVLPLRMR